MPALADLTDEELRAMVEAKRQPSISALTDEQLQGEVTQKRVDEILSPPAPTFIDKLVKKADEVITGVAEPALTFATGAGAEVAAGFGGLLETAISGPEEGQKTIEAIREAGTFQPRTKSGREGLKAVGEFLEPVGKGFKFLEEKAGEFAFDISEGRSPTTRGLAGAAGAALPTAATEILGFGIVKRLAKTRLAPDSATVKAALQKSAPTTQKLRKGAQEIFDAVDEAGGTIRSGSVQDLVGDLKAAALEAGAGEGTPSIRGVLKDIDSLLGKEIRELDPITGKTTTSFLSKEANIGRILQLRKQIQAITKEGTSRAIGTAMISTLDDFIANADASVFRIAGGPLSASQIGPQLTLARELWRRAKRGETMEQIMKTAADNTSTSFDTSIRKQLASLVDDPKKARFLDDGDEAAIRAVLKGSGTQTTLRMLAKLGFSNSQSVNMFGGVIGFAIGNSLFGPGGGLAVATAGSIARAVTDVMTKGGVRFADALIRAGSEGRQIVAAYNKYVPRAKQSVNDLSILLLRGDVNLSSLPKGTLISEAAVLAANRRKALIAAAGAGTVQSEIGQLTQ